MKSNFSTPKSEYHTSNALNICSYRTDEQKDRVVNNIFKNVDNFCFENQIH